MNQSRGSSQETSPKMRREGAVGDVREDICRPTAPLTSRCTSVTARGAAGPLPRPQRTPPPRSPPLPLPAVKGGVTMSSRPKPETPPPWLPPDHGPPACIQSPSLANSTRIAYFYNLATSVTSPVFRLSMSLAATLASAMLKPLWFPAFHASSGVHALSKAISTAFFSSFWPILYLFSIDNPSPFFKIH